MDKKSYIENVLTISTANIRPETADWLDSQVQMTKNNDMRIIVYPKGVYGYFIPLYIEMLEEKFGVPSDLTFLIGFAFGKNCSYLHIDRDAEIVEDLQRFEWL